MARRLLIFGQALATVLFLFHFQNTRGQQWVGWLVPLLVLGLIAINSVWPSRLICWIIFSISFAGFLLLLSAFTLRWRVESGFDPKPFYRAMLMYVTFIYVSLGQLKIYVGGSSRSSVPTGGNQ